MTLACTPSAPTGGQACIEESNVHITKALDCYCTGANWCYVAAASAGNLQIGYALSMYGNSVRNSSAVPTGGVCTKAQGGARQVGWNIKFVDIAGSAAGGSKQARLAGWAALLSFNDEVPAGANEIRLPLFGKLVRDTRPVFPITLRDIDGFVL